MPARTGVRVIGLDDFRKELKNFSPELAKDMGAINKEAATIVLTKAIKNAMALGGSARKGVKSMTASRKQKAAIIAIGGAKNPWMAGAEFGASRYAQFHTWRGNQWTADADEIGYFLHPAILETADEFDKFYLNKLAEISAKAFPK